nr:3-dehydroquinate synthase [uncultured Desulfuromonas sp.]
MEQLSVGLGDRSYQILIAHQGFVGLCEELQRIEFPRKVVIVTNTTVFPLYGSSVRQLLEDAEYDVEQIVVEDGESYKNAETLNTIYTRLIELGCDRHSGIIALGGGVVGDMAGYAAATYLRGVPFVQIPTTVLAQVDSSVGGKTAINHPLGKNLIGAFYQPQAVFINVATLSTLDHRNILAGIAEVIKYGVMFDEGFFSWLEAHVDSLLALDTEALAYAIRRSCELKAEVVAADERESSVRAVLNYGHTFGHAVEQLSGYGTVLHGEAVAIGMLVAAKVSKRLGYCHDLDVDRLARLLDAFGLVTVPPAFPLEDYLAAMGRDKKVHSGVLRFIVNVGIGQSRIVSLDDPESVFKSVLG